MIDFSRVQKELQDCERDKDSSGIRVCPKADNLTRLTGTIPGPIGTPYEGGTFQIDITMPGPNQIRLLLRSLIVKFENPEPSFWGLWCWVKLGASLDFVLIG